MSDFSSKSSPVQTISFLKSPEPTYETIVLAPYNTTPDDQNQVEFFSMEQLTLNFEQTLRLQVKGAQLVLDPSSTTETSSLFLDLSHGEIVGYNGLESKQLQGLRSIALKMSSKGCLDQLIDVYVSERKSFANAHFQKYWDGKLSSNDIHRLEWDNLEPNIYRWIKAANFTFCCISTYEKQFSNGVFSELGNGISDSCFVAIVGDCVTQLLDFAESVSSCRRSSDRLQTILLLYKKFYALMPHMKSMFDSEVALSFHTRGENVLSKLGEVVALTMCDFEDAILNDLSNDAVPEGCVHRLTKYVMNYITNLIVENKETLSKLMTLRPLKWTELLDGLELQRQTPLAEHLLVIIMVLLQNLQGKSKNYLEPALSFLFMMNNFDYIAQQIRRSEVLKEMIGDDYLNKLAENIDTALAGYLRATWDGPLYCLNSEGSYVSCAFSSALSKSASLRERVKNFNLLFKQIHKTQGMWSVHDQELRAKLHQSIIQKMIPPYKNILGEFGSRIERKKCSEKCAPFSVQELENKIKGLFGYQQFS